MNDIVGEKQQNNAQTLRRYISKYNENRDLVLMGGYVQGQDPDLDKALALWPEIIKFLQQGEEEVLPLRDFASATQNFWGLN